MSAASAVAPDITFEHIMQLIRQASRFIDNSIPEDVVRSALSVCSSELFNQVVTVHYRVGAVNNILLSLVRYGLCDTALHFLHRFNDDIINFETPESFEEHGGDVALHYALDFNHIPLALALIERMTPEAIQAVAPGRRYGETTALQIATKKGMTDVIEAIKEKLI
jgi:hypothetical protein